MIKIPFLTIPFGMLAEEIKSYPHLHHRAPVTRSICVDRAPLDTRFLMDSLGEEKVQREIPKEFRFREEQPVFANKIFHYTSFRDITTSPIEKDCMKILEFRYNTLATPESLSFSKSFMTGPDRFHSLHFDLHFMETIVYPTEDNDPNDYRDEISSQIKAMDFSQQVQNTKLLFMERCEVYEGWCFSSSRHLECGLELVEEFRMGIREQFIRDFYILGDNGYGDLLRDYIEAVINDGP